MSRRFLQLVAAFFLAALFLSASLSVKAQTPTASPTPRDPRNFGFTPLAYPCSRNTVNFHPLRPYPGSPCDPLIPRKSPWATDDPNKLYITPLCGKDLNPKGTVTAPDVVDATGGQITEFPPDWHTATYDKLYFCVGSRTQICFIKLIHYNVNVNLDKSVFPIVGYTENQYPDAVNVNEYLDWYLGGTVNYPSDLNPKDPDDIFRLVNFSGPTKKLVAKYTQDSLQNLFLTGPDRGVQFHAYTVAAPTDINAPLSSYEDITSEATVGFYPNDQPRSPEIDGEILQIGLTIGSDADSRLYFPHLRDANAFSDLLAGITRPQPASISAYREITSQKIPVHQGTACANNPSWSVPGGADTTLVYCDKEWTGFGINDVTRNTEVIPGAAAPAPLVTLGELPTGQQTCELGQTNGPGDTLLGKSIPATFTYVQLFRYTPQVIIMDSCSAGGGGSNCRDNCVKEGGDCSTQLCCYGSCIPSSCSQNSSAPPWCVGLNCDLLSGTSCSSNPCCTYTPPACPAWPTVELKSGVREAVFTKTPFIERIYDTLVVGTRSIMRRFMPQKDASNSAEYLDGETGLNHALPGATSYAFGGSSPELNNDVITAGAGSDPQLFFPRLNSLAQQFLGGYITGKPNLQCFFRPYDLTYCELPSANSATTSGGINCDQNAPEPDWQGLGLCSKDVVHDVASRWLGRGHDYVLECYNDVVDRALAAGVDPGWALWAWLHESDASNYSAFTYPIQDFGVNDWSIANNFDAQITRFLPLGGYYKSVCGKSDWETFIAMYYDGNCYPSARSYNYLHNILMPSWNWVNCGRPFPSYPGP